VILKGCHPLFPFLEKLCTLATKTNVPCNSYKGIWGGGGDGPKSPYFQEKKSEFAII